MYILSFTTKYVFDKIANRGHWELTANWSDGKKQVIEAVYSIRDEAVKRAMEMHKTSGKPGTMCNLYF